MHRILPTPQSAHPRSHSMPCVRSKVRSKVQVPDLCISYTYACFHPPPPSDSSPTPHMHHTTPHRNSGRLPLLRPTHCSHSTDPKPKTEPSTSAVPTLASVTRPLSPPLLPQTLRPLNPRVREPAPFFTNDSVGWEPPLPVDVGGATEEVGVYETPFNEAATWKTEPPP